MEASDATFQGDGAYVGDGGAWLQKLWELCPWKEIKGCPGRYVIPKKGECATTHAELLRRDGLGFDPAQGCTELRSDGCVDGLVLTIFPGGGGLLTYCKADGVTQVHTLNTRSGLARKLGALGLEAVLAEKTS